MGVGKDDQALADGVHRSKFEVEARERVYIVGPQLVCEVGRFR